MNFGLYLIRRNVVVVRCRFRHVSGATASSMAAAVSATPSLNPGAMRSANANSSIGVKFNGAFCKGYF